MQSAGSPLPVVSLFTGEINFPMIPGEPTSSAIQPFMWFGGLMWSIRMVNSCFVKPNPKAWNSYGPPTLIPALLTLPSDRMDVCMSPICTEESFRMLIYVIRLRKISVDTTHVDALEETAEDVRDPPKDAQGYARIIKSTMNRILSLT